MKTVQVGLVVSLFFFIVPDVKAQQWSGAGSVPGIYVNRPVLGETIITQPGIINGLPGTPPASGTVIGETITSGFVGQPVVGGNVVGAVPTSLGVTNYPAQSSIMPYSYWVSAPQPARIYVEYGSNDHFPFQGRAYGSPNDRWSWYYMGGGDSRYLARYYYPPLR